MCSVWSADIRRRLLSIEYMTKKEQQEQERAQAIAYLKDYFKQGDTVYTALKHVSSSGMSRQIAVYAAGISDRDGKPFVYQVSHLVAQALGYKRADNGALKVGGAGMDMGFHVAYSLARVLFKDDFVCTGEGCISNDHRNGDKIEKGQQHSDAGYSLTHTWL